MWFGKSDKITLRVGGMSCAHCERTVENALREIAGVARVKADHIKGQVRVTYKGQTPDGETVKRKITELGYTVTV